MEDLKLGVRFEVLFVVHRKVIILRCDAMYSGGMVPVFWRNLLPLSSGSLSDYASHPRKPEIYRISW
jgi:hypothetical protein